MPCGRRSSSFAPSRNSRSLRRLRARGVQALQSAVHFTQLRAILDLNAKVTQAGIAAAFADREVHARSSSIHFGVVRLQNRGLAANSSR